MNALNKYAPILASGTGVFAVIAAIAGWIFTTGQRDAQLSDVLSEMTTIRSTVLTMAAKQDDQGETIAYIKGRLDGSLPSRLGALSP